MKFTTNVPEPQQMPNKATRSRTDPSHPQSNHKINIQPDAILLESPNTNNDLVVFKQPIPPNHIATDTQQIIINPRITNPTVNVIGRPDDEDIWTNNDLFSNYDNLHNPDTMDQDISDIMSALSLDKEFSDILSNIDNKSNASSSTKPNVLNVSNVSKNKRKKRKKLRKNDKNNGVSYNPNTLFRAQGNIQISKQFTANIIPMRIRENISNIYSYIDKYTALCLGINENHNEKIRIFNYNFHDKMSNNLLFCVIQRQDMSCNASRGYKWKMVNKLYNISELQSEFAIQQIPKSFEDSVIFESYLNDKQQVENILMNHAAMQTLIDNTPWHKVAIFNKVNNKRRMHLFLTKPEFMKQCRDFVSVSNLGNKKVNLIPILMFNDNDANEFWIEYVWIITIDNNINIGISLKYNNMSNIVKVSGIHLDCFYLHGQHQLVLPYHSNECDCFKSWKSNINYLSIGNPDDSLNKIKYYKQQIDELTKYKLQLQMLQKQTADNLIQIDHKNPITYPNAAVFASPQHMYNNSPLNIATTTMHNYYTSNISYNSSKIASSYNNNTYNQ